MRFNKPFRILQKLNKWHVATLMILLLAANLLMMGVSFARYRTEYENQSNIGVVGFSPSLQGVSEGDFTVPGNKTFTVTNGDGTLGLQVTITVIPEGALPLSYRLFTGEQAITLEWDAEKGAYVANDIVMPVGTIKKEFTLVSEWASEEYDERFAGVQENVKIRVLCEQLEGE